MLKQELIDFTSDAMNKKWRREGPTRDSTARETAPRPTAPRVSALLDAVLVQLSCQSHFDVSVGAPCFLAADSGLEALV